MKTVKFSDVVTRANTKEDRFNTDKIYYVGGEHIDSNEMKIEKRGVIAGSTIGPMFYCGFKSGDILFVTRNPHLRKCGVVNFDGICSEKTFVLETKNRDILLQEYLAIVMQSDDFWNYCEENKSGGVNYFLNWSTLAEYEFYLPSLAEQKVLAEKLWAAYEVKQSYLKMIAATEEMVKAQFVEMFGDPIQNSKGWVKEKMGSVCKYISDGSHYSPPDDNTSIIPMLSVKDMSNNGFLYNECKHISIDEYKNLCANGCKPLRDDVLVAKDGSYFKYIFPLVEERDQAILSSIAILRPNKEVITPRFLCEYLKNNEVLGVIERNYLTGTAIRRVILKGFKEIQVYLPPVGLQKNFENIYNQADKSISELRKSVDAIDKVIKSLINENL